MATSNLTKAFGALAIAVFGVAPAAADAKLLQPSRIVDWTGAAGAFSGAALETALTTETMKDPAAEAPDFRHDTIRVWATNRAWYVLPLDPVGKLPEIACPSANGCPDVDGAKP
ncbi:hypothetical protein [Aurantimonas sp. VKM B-3413]|uniref:hypothetical protein n=1 Tax=Aurantimonas sp. VKM B-3413 TaxID=2779401 RepID=UPI001E2A915E|nr:hypothetical protein [Aurantimonas sp. VKM B-3413]MCB8837918.1 hypothetical protein [Aurantimonas sp. VKM B-3413]